MQLRRDAAHAVRSLTRTPGFTIVVLLTLTLGIGGNSAIFSVVNAVLLRALPVAEPERLLVVWESRIDEGENYMFASPPNYADWRAQNEVFEDLGAFAPRDYLLELPDETIRVHGSRITASLLPVLGVSPVVGRAFTDDEDHPGAARVALISHRLWQSAFSGRADIAGSIVQLDNGAYTIVGVMPDAFHFPPPVDLEGRTFPRQNDIWTPLALDPAALGRGAHFLTVVGRLRPGMSAERADSEMGAIADRLALDHPETNAEYRIRLVPFERVVLGNLRLALIVLLAAVSAVLLIACVNVANLLLTRSAALQKEYVVRAALGAGRWPLVRHALVESQLLALAGGAAGLAIAAAGTGALRRLAPGNVPGLSGASIDPTVVAYTLTLSIATGLIFGIVPALRTFSPDLAGLLRSGGRSSAGSIEHSRLRSTLVIAEVALSLVLLASAGLLFNSFLALRAVDTGVLAERVLTMRLNLAARHYPENSRVAATFRTLEERISALPGVASASFSLDLPLASDYQGTRVTIEGEPQPEPGEELRTHFSVVTPRYFETMGIPLVSGRSFRAEDAAEAAPVVLVNETFARLYLPGRDLVGRRLLYGEPHTVIGVVGDVRLETLTSDATPAMYLPHAQSATRSMSLIVKTTQDPLAVTARVRDAIRTVDRGIAIYDVKTMEQIVSESMAQPRFAAFMLLMFSGVALVLAGVGLYGVISFIVARQGREIGIRMALGAQPMDELKRIVGRGAMLLGAGLAIGLAAAIAATRVLRSLLFEVEPADPATLAVTTLFLLCIGLCACALPARRASRMDPMNALRYE
jgi:putative ABC transport system permease protein